MNGLLARLSLEYKLPLAVTALLGLVIGGFAWLAYRELGNAAVEAASERLVSVTAQLEQLLAASTRQRLSETQAAARQRAVQEFLRAATPARRSEVAASLAPLAPPEGQALAVEVWDVTGGRVATVGGEVPPIDPATARPLIAAAGADTAAIGPFHLVNDSIAFMVIAAVPGEGRALGYVVQHRRVSSNPRAAAQLAGLMGSDAALLFGNRTGEIWTDLTARTGAPPVELPAEGGAVTYERRGRGAVLARAAPIPETPWMLVVEFPLDRVLAHARGTLSHLGVIALVLVALGAAGAWAASRRITAPLAEVTRAAEAIAADQPAPRLALARRDEVGRLAASFTTMAERVAAARERLEVAVAERTRELEEASGAVRASEERFRALAHTANDAIVSADARGIIMYVNPAAERTFGYAADEMVGRALTILMPERLHEVHRAGFERYLATGQGGVVGRTVELVGRRKDGTEFPLELSLAAWRSGDEIFFTGIVRDITERKQAEELRTAHLRALDRVNAQLQAVNSELEGFTYSVSHDLRAPLRAIDGFSRILLEDHADSLGGEGQRLLGVVRKNTQRMGELIDDLLAFSRLGRQELVTTQVDMEQLARAAVDDLAGQQPERQVEVRVESLEPVQGDRGLLRQVWVNLVSNALKYTRPRSDPRIEITCSGNGAETVYSVKDNGVGFDMRYADKLFGVFQRLHRPDEFEGTGVGLAIVERIVHRHGGRVWAVADVDRGATFFFALPNQGGRG